jgi:acyl carrier protein
MENLAMHDESVLNITVELIRIAVDTCDDIDIVPEIRSDSDITESFGFDSLSFMDFIAAVEEHYGIVFRDDITFEELNTVSGLINEIIHEKKNHTHLP